MRILISAIMTRNVTVVLVKKILSPQNIQDETLKAQKKHCLYLIRDESETSLNTVVHENV